MIKKVPRADGSVVHQVYAKRDGKKVYVGSYGTRREALAADEEHRVTVRKIDAGQLPPDLDLKRTFRVAVTEWLEMLEKNPTAKGARSRDHYDSVMEKHVMPTFEHVPIVDIRKSSVLRWRDHVKGISAATINNVLGAMSSAFTFFVGRDWVSINPCRGIRMLEKQPKVFPWIHNTETITTLLAELRTNIRTIVAVLVGTGLRLDEALYLRWDDIDLEHRLITVHRGAKGTTKSGKMRRVPIFDSVLPVLKAMKLARGGAQLLWPGGMPGKRSATKPLSQPTVRFAFKDAAETVGLPKALRIHDLRHTFASLFLIDGGDIFKLSRILGHSSVAITERTYAHLKPAAFEADYGRVAFRMPDEPAQVIPFARVGGDSGGDDAPRSVNAL